MTQIGTSIAILPPPNAASEGASVAQSFADPQAQSNSFLQSLTANGNSAGGNSNPLTIGNAGTNENTSSTAPTAFAATTGSSQAPPAPGDRNGDPSTNAASAGDRSAAPTNGGKKSQAGQNGATQSQSTQNQSTQYQSTRGQSTTSSATSPKSPAASSNSADTTSQIPAATLSDAARLQATNAAAAQHAASTTSSTQDAKASSAASSAPAALAQLLQSGTDKTHKSNGSAATTDPNQPVVAPNGLVKVLTLARTAQEAAANKEPSQSNQSENSGGTQTSGTKQDASAANATALGLSSAAASAESAAATVAVNQSTPGKGSAASDPSQGSGSSLSVRPTIASSANATTAAELNAVANQLGTADTAVLTTQLVTETAVDRTQAETNSANARTDSGSSAVGKPSDKNTAADSVAAAAERVAPAALTAGTPSPAGPTAASSTSATGTATSPNAQSAQDLANRVADSLRSGFDRGGELRVRLEPPALGKVQIEVQADSGAVSARLEVQTPAARQTLLDNISLLHDAIGQTGATVNRIEIEVVPQQHQDANNSEPRDSNSGSQQQNSGDSGSQNQSNNPSGGGQRQNQRWRSTSAIDTIDIEI